MNLPNRVVVLDEVVLVVVPVEDLAATDMLHYCHLCISFGIAVVLNRRDEADSHWLVAVGNQGDMVAEESGEGRNAAAIDDLANPERKETSY
jgi:hypothetical protein